MQNADDVARVATFEITHGKDAVSNPPASRADCSQRHLAALNL